MRKLLLPVVFSMAISFWASGCIPVEDLGEYWGKGTIDPELEGHWEKTGKSKNFLSTLGFSESSL